MGGSCERGGRGAGGMVRDMVGMGGGFSLVFFLIVNLGGFRILSGS